MGYAPVRVTPPVGRIVSIEEAMRQCRITLDPGDADQLSEVTSLLGGYIDAATDHLDGYDGIMGRCLLPQVWRQDFDGFARFLDLDLGPVAEDGIQSIEWADCANALNEIDPAHYRLLTTRGGKPYVRFSDSFSPPSGLAEAAAVQVTYRAGSDEVPKQVRQAILLIVGAWYENREEVTSGGVTPLPESVAIDRLLAPLRKVGL